MKRALRDEIRRLCAAVTAEEAASAARTVFGRIEATGQFAGARTVALYCSIEGELPTGEVMARWSASKRIVLPFIEGETMHFAYYDPAQGLCEGAFCIAEPAARETCPPEEIDMMVIPGMAFDREGHRLGRGKGFYDRFLGALPRQPFKVGVCHPFQLFDAIPHEAHDVVMDIVVAG